MSQLVCLRQKGLLGLVLLVNCKLCLKSTNLVTRSFATWKMKAQSTMTNVLKHIVSCEEMGMQAPFEGVCFAHGLFKANQFAISNEKIS